MDAPPFNPVPLLSQELQLATPRVAAAVKLLEDGNTVPFIARYRKEATGGLDEVQIRTLQERLAYHQELEDRRQTVLNSIAEQNKLTDDLRAKILACTNKTDLEDLYLPYKPKRRTRAAIARERGLAPLAERILAQPREGNPEREAAAFVNPEKDVPDVVSALQGARDIVAETVADKAEVRAFLRQSLQQQGVLVSAATKEAKTQRTKFEQYYDFREPLTRIPSHRYLAIRRGEEEGMLKVSLDLDATRLTPRILQMCNQQCSSPFAGQLQQAVEDAYERLLLPSVSTEVHTETKDKSDIAAVDVFAENLRNLLLASPLGGKAVIGVDPGLRTGCKCVFVDAVGAFRDNLTIYPSQGPGALEQARKDFLALVQRTKPAAIAIGNGTGGRETETFARETLKQAGLQAIPVVSVNEAGASVYSASDVAREEFPDLDLTVRGAISIARRLQDPLAELVKIDPKAIGVGQYQHDVHQPLLQKKLGEVIESCVNLVGVELNTASAPLLSYVAGIGPKLAEKIVKHREEHGAFADRASLRKVPKLGPKTFEQAAGFLRVRESKNPLDASAVHPERYTLVERMAKDLQAGLKELVGNVALAQKIPLRNYLGDGVGEPTLRDILAELQKPGRDPRATFEPPKFRDDVQTLDDVQPGMELEGVVTNVTAFGAFVDIGVHQDGLVHVSQLADHFVRDPAEIVKAGQRIKVRVLDVDRERKRIALSAKKKT
jgi:protein Tex